MDPFKASVRGTRRFVCVSISSVAALLMEMQLHVRNPGGVGLCSHPYVMFGSFCTSTFFKFCSNITLNPESPGLLTCRWSCGTTHGASFRTKDLGCSTDGQICMEGNHKMISFRRSHIEILWKRSFPSLLDMSL